MRDFHAVTVLGTGPKGCGPFDFYQGCAVGQLVGVHCFACDYREDLLTIGTGFNGPDDVSMALARCDTCQRILSVNLASKRVRCGKCRRRPAPFPKGRAKLFAEPWDAAMRPFSAPDDPGDGAGLHPKHECPRCHQRAMIVAGVGIWD